ncbi:MAG: hypothetical protein IJT13_02770 [Bacteroidaceae bacterium]|nr:hypothetical protein [Bacteroidaceae bacterium]
MKSYTYNPYLDDELVAPEVKLNLTDINASRAEEERARIVEMGIDTKQPEQNKEKSVNFWYIVLVILSIIANLILFIPLCLLGFFGLSNHPFIGYFMFRDMMRR